jgi:hypothetical protein
LIPASARHRCLRWRRLAAGSCLVWTATIAACQQPGANSPSDGRPATSQLWAATAGKYLADPLWTDGQAYDAGHYLMIPLHAAFRLGRADWQRAFADHFARFAAGWTTGTTTDANRLARLQYFYLAAEFLTLGAKQPDLVPRSLPDLLQIEILEAWALAPAPQWDRKPFFGGMRERLTWKLSQAPTTPTYYRAVLDDELYVMAIAADLRRYARQSGWTGLDTALVNDILTSAVAVFEQRAAWHGGGWLFQPGVWADHPDFAYAGQSAAGPDLQPAPVADVAEDVSHSHRMPLWLRSFAEAYPAGSPERRSFEQLSTGLGIQFFGHVLRRPTPRDGPITTANYMDGRDGLYRWGHATQGPGRGYGPSELSGTLTLGWWAFLADPQAGEVYRDLAGRFPLDSATLALYVGPNTSRIRHPLVTDPDAFNNGFRELLARLAGDL